MENIIGFIGVGSAIGFSFVMALGLEWLCLRALMFLMPGRTEQRSARVEITVPPQQVSWWASFGYPKDATGRHIGLGADRTISVARKLRGEVAGELLTASGRVRLNRVVLP